MKLVVNASPIIFLSKIEMIDYLPEMVEQLVIPRAVGLTKPAVQGYFIIRHDSSKSVIFPITSSKPVRR